MNRLTSKALWVAVIAQLMVILQVTGALEISQIELVNTVVMAILQVLVLFGVLNNPTDKSNF